MLWRHLSHEPATKKYSGKLHILKPVSPRVRVLYTSHAGVDLGYGVAMQRLQ